MFNTDMHITTFIILVVQCLVLFSQFLFYLIKPKDSSRIRFICLTICYIFYNFFSGIFPDPQYDISIFLQNIVAYIVGIVVAIYFVYYIYKEFNIYPFKGFKVSSLLWILLISFLILFIIPYYLTNDLNFSKRIFIGIPLIISISFLYQIGRQLCITFKSKAMDTYFNKRITSGYLGLFSISLMPVLVALGDYQSIEQPVVNAGFLIMMIVYTSHIIYKTKSEALELEKLKNKIVTKKEVQISEDIQNTIINSLQTFEREEKFLDKNISIKTVASQLNTNTKYLSKVINNYQGISFIQYINHHRIQYCLEHLHQKDSDWLRYSIKSIADECGFSSAESFSRAFKKHTSIKPSDYIKNIDQKTYTPQQQDKKPS